MFENVPIDEKYEYDKEDITEEFEHKPLLLSIPKVEPLFSNISNWNEDTPNIGELTIPFTTPYKVKDPIILLERCDKIWETLKMIRTIQNKDKINGFDALSLGITTTQSTNVLNDNKYIEYQPILGNNNASLPNFKLSVKNKRKVYTCPTCGKQYNENRTLRYHSQKVHGIYIPTKKDHKSQKSQRNDVANTNSHVSTSETMKTEQEKRMSNKEMNNEKKNSLQNSTALSTCTLCKQSVKDMRKHLVDYHKIESPDFMLKNLDDRLTVSGGNKLKTNIFNDEQKMYFQNKRRRNSNVQYTNSKKRHKANSPQMEENDMLEMKKKDIRKCDICLGMYKGSSYSRHIRIHRSRGETKENFHLSTQKYVNSPLYRAKINTKTNDMLFESTNDNVKDNSNSSKSFIKEKEEQVMQSESKDKKMSDVCICSCGRSFRNPHTLFTHKKYCVSSKELELPRRESSVNRNKHCVTRNGSDGNSGTGTGISITIKKKNNSYEIIDKDNRSRNKLQDMRHTEVVNTSLDTSESNTEIELQSYSHEILELSKYSEEHSILKIESANEDIDIDIEDDSEGNFSTDNISNSACEIVNNFSGELVVPTIKIEQDDKSCQESINSEFLQETARTKKNCKQSNDITVNFETKYNICVCGYQFYTKRALEIHVRKHHSGSKLLCGYCKANFHSAVEWNKHLCTIHQGKKFIPLPMEINCHHCNITLHTYKKFDEHIKHKHFDPMLPFHCFQCHKRFANNTTRKIHLHTDHKVTICSICNNTCLDFMKSRHKAYHYGLGFPCHFCKRTYTSKVYLLKHNRTIHNKILNSPTYDLNKLSFMNSTTYDLHMNS